MKLRIRTRTGAPRTRAGRRWSGEWTPVDSEEFTNEQLAALHGDAGLDVRELATATAVESAEALDTVKAEVARLAEVNKAAESEIARLNERLKRAGDAGDGAVQRALKVAEEKHAGELTAEATRHRELVDQLTKAHETELDAQASEHAEEIEKLTAEIAKLTAPPPTKPDAAKAEHAKPDHAKAEKAKGDDAKGEKAAK